MVDQSPVSRDEIVQQMGEVIRPKLLERTGIEPMDAHLLALECADDALRPVEERFAIRLAEPA